MILSTKEIK